MFVTEKLKLWLAAIIFLAVIYLASYADLSAGARFGLSAIGMVLVGVLVFFSQSGRDFSRFVQDAGVELRKVVWPNKQETMQLTGFVFLVLLVTVFFLWLLDTIISNLFGLLYN